MTGTFTIREGDQLPPIEGILKSADGTIIDLTNADSVMFHMKSNSNQLKVSAPATIVNAAAGHVAYSWAEDDTSTPGSYFAEFEVIWPNDLKQSFPNRDYIRVIVTRQVA